MDIFDSKMVSPMLIGKKSDPFDDPNFIFELKLNGDRCIAYLDKDSTFLSSSKLSSILPKYPELDGIHKHVKRKCILDGEIIELNEGKPDIGACKKRAELSNVFEIERLAKTKPATFVAYDILYYDREPIINMPLLARKDLLNKNIIDGDRISHSQFIEQFGSDFFSLIRDEDLDGLVAKEITSSYQMGKRSNDWVNIKNQQEEDFVICGYYLQEDEGALLVLGKHSPELKYAGTITIPAGENDLKVIEDHPKIVAHPFEDTPPRTEAHMFWLTPDLVCKVRFMGYEEDGNFRQPNYKGLQLNMQLTK